MKKTNKPKKNPKQKIEIIINPSQRISPLKTFYRPLTSPGYTIRINQIRAKKKKKKIHPKI